MRFTGRLWTGLLPTDGCIIVAPFANDPALKQMIDRGAPVVAADPDPDRKSFRFWAGRDKQPGVKELLDHLHKKGARRIALVLGQDENSWTPGSRDAYVRWVSRRRMKQRLYDRAEAAGLESGIDIGTTLLQRRDRPDAIISASSLFAAGITTAAHWMLLSIPTDVRVAALSDSEAVHGFVPAITALDLQPEIIGRVCIEMPFDLVAGKTPNTFRTRNVLRRRPSSD